MGITAAADAPFPAWSPQSSLELMDRNEIKAAILSLSAPGVFFGDAKLARDLARECNEFAARVAGDYPQRFGWFAAVPTPDAEAALSEATYALDTLNADGLVLLASSGGRFLGDPDFEELMTELNRRYAIVFIHPNIHPSTLGLALKIPGFFIEFLFDTTRAVTNLLFTGAFERYPNIRWIIAHAGATIPYIVWRLSLAEGLPQFRERIPRGVATYLKRLYYDTALSPSPNAMASLLELTDPSHILFGSDFPFAPAPVVEAEVDALDRLSVFTPEIRRKVDCENALALFPRFR